MLPFYWHECPDGQNGISDMVLMTTISRREKKSIESDIQKAPIVRRTFTIIRKGTNRFLHYCRIFYTPPRTCTYFVISCSSARRWNPGQQLNFYQKKSGNQVEWKAVLGYSGCFVDESGKNQVYFDTVALNFSLFLQ